MNSLVDGVTYLLTGDVADAEGLFHGDTRHLSPIGVAVSGENLTLVDDSRRPPSRRTRRYADASSAVNEISETVEGKHATMLFTRRQSVREGRLVERFEFVNRDTRDRSVEVTLGFDADFADIFEVRKLRAQTPRDVAASRDGRSVTYRYEYADRTGDATRLETTVAFDREPAILEPGRATFELSPGPGERFVITAEVRPGGDESTVRAPAATVERDPPDSSAVGPADGSVDPFAVDAPLESGDPDYDRVFEQSRRDLRALTTRSEHGPVLLAGAPWFVTVFGRDALLASYLLLPFAPSLARGTLRYLAAHQGAAREDRNDEAPGKILHEIRRGELARTGTIPQDPYYGTIDATPLWVTLLHETWRWTGDDELVASLWGNLEAALDWLERAVAAGEDEFLYYRDLGDGGVTHKVWRDSANGVQYADGTSAEPPLAGAAVQGYLYDALRRAAALADDVRGDAELSRDLAARAEALGDRFDDAFWLPDRDCYATAVTEDGRRVDSVTSAVAHCLWSGVVPDDRTDEVADRLLAPDLRTRWGLRTLSAADDGYSPLSYHAGGIWPHDNAIAALGLASGDRRDDAAALVVDQLDALVSLGEHGAPELFCGFDDEPAPVPFPSACRPQAWAAAAPFGFLRALFDLDPETGDVPVESRGPLERSAVEPVLDRWR